MSKAGDVSITQAAKKISPSTTFCPTDGMTESERAQFLELVRIGLTAAAAHDSNRSLDRLGAGWPRTVVGATLSRDGQHIAIEIDAPGLPSDRAIELRQPVPEQPHFLPRELFGENFTAALQAAIIDLRLDAMIKGL